MIPIPSGVRVWIATGHTDMRRGMNSLALQVQQGLKRDPHAGDCSFSVDGAATW
jgi:transposase